MRASQESCTPWRRAALTMQNRPVSNETNRAGRKTHPFSAETRIKIRNMSIVTLSCGPRRQFQRYGMFEGHMCFKHKDYLNWLWSSEEISSLSSIGLPLKNPRAQ